jgi:hypothetical protein
MIASRRESVFTAYTDWDLERGEREGRGVGSVIGLHYFCLP